MFSDIEPENPKFAAAQALALHLNEYVDPSGRFAFHPAEVVDRQSATAAIVSLLQLTHRLGPLTPADAEAVLATVHDAAKISPSLRPYVAAAINAGFFYMPHRTCFFLCCVLQALGSTRHIRLRLPRIARLRRQSNVQQDISCRPNPLLEHRWRFSSIACRPSDRR